MRGRAALSAESCLSWETAELAQYRRRHPARRRNLPSPFIQGGM